MTLACFDGWAADSGGPTPPDAASARVIVRFRPDAGDPTDPAFLEALAHAARVRRIELIRPMSGDSYVMRIVCGDPLGAVREPCDAAIARIRASSPVLLIEADGRETSR